VLTDDLEAAKTSKATALKEAEEAKAELAEQKKLKSELEEKLSQAEEESKNLKAELKNLEGKKSALEKKVNELQEKLKSGVELGTIVVNPETGQQPALAVPPTSGTAISAPGADVGLSAPAGPAEEGKVLVVNKDYNFAVINLGSEDGVGVGNVYAVYHNNKYLGDVKVEKVHDSMAAAAFAAADLKDKVSEGDKVILKTK
jgi:hypothetical protein